MLCLHHLGFLFLTWILKHRHKEVCQDESEGLEMSSFCLGILWAYRYFLLSANLFPPGPPFLTSRLPEWRIRRPGSLRYPGGFREGDWGRLAPLMCSPTKNVTSLLVLLFRIECERFTERLISSLVKLRPLKASPFHGAPDKSSGAAREVGCKGWTSPALSEALSTDASRYFYLPSAGIIPQVFAERKWLGVYLLFLFFGEIDLVSGIVFGSLIFVRVLLLFSG